MVDDGVIKPLGELVGSRRYARDLTHLNRITYTKRWWGPYKAEPINEPPTVTYSDIPGVTAYNFYDTPQLKLDLE